MEGCDCCEVDGKLVEDGFSWISNNTEYGLLNKERRHDITLMNFVECCRGDIVIKTSPPEPTAATTTTTTSSSEGKTTFTFTTSFQNSKDSVSVSNSLSTFIPATTADQSSVWNMPKPQPFPGVFTPGFGILITGGKGSNTAELLDSSGNGTNCSLPDIPSKERWRHTQTGRVLCGGSGGSNDGGPATTRNYETTCLKLFNSGWSKNPLKYLLDRRSGHTSWKSEKGLLLMGGLVRVTRDNTEMLTRNKSETTAEFPLKYSSL